ncbi:hypothetical protein [Robertmurraya sp.]|uniref:hypothetical protein n=1 Tax=Robertmurraya sp. TaxID=2837525 RepID=UPI0037038D0F
MSDFKDKVLQLLLEQSKIEQYVNPHLLSAILSGLYDCGALDNYPDQQELNKLERYISDMWSW